MQNIKPQYYSLEELLLDYTNDFLDMMLSNKIDSGALADKYIINNKLENEEDRPKRQIN